MVNKCSAINCRSGYSGESKNPNITFHSFPLNDEKLLKIWLKNIARKDFTPTKYSRLCFLHFKLDDFREDSSDQTQSRKKQRKDLKLLKRRLKKDAVPTNFKNLPSYYLSDDVPSRSGLSLASSRLENAARALEEQAEKFLEEDQLANFENLLKAIEKEKQLPKDFIVHHTDAGVNLIYLSDSQPPSIFGTVIIDRNLKVTMYVGQQLVSASLYKHIVATETVSLFSQVTNLMAFLKNLDHPKYTCAMSVFNEKIVQLIEEYLDTEEHIEPHHRRLYSFVSEQLQLMSKNKHQRRYSVELLLLSFIMNATSSKAYERLLEEQILILPSPKTLKKITMNLDKKNGLDDAGYLKMRFSKLNAFDRNVLLMIDEIYLSKRVEVSGGQVYGFTDGCDVAATALCLMIKSLSSGYKDMVAMYPIKHLRAETQKECYDKVMTLLHEIGFNVIAISVDNAPANRKFFKDFLCEGSLKESVDNDFTGGKIFLIFDPTHIIKNIYNNFLSKRLLELPCVPPLVPNQVRASFGDIDSVYSKECQKPLKIAHRLSETVLHPKAIEKVNVKLALSVFHESTVNALRHFRFHDTASFVELFLKFWSVINVSSSTIGKRKRDYVRDPVKSTEDWKLDFLLDFAQFVTAWENSKVSWVFIIILS